MKAAEKIGIPPENCVVFEDAINGVQAGKNAGMKVVGITTTHERDELSDADIVISDFTEIDVGKVRALFD